MCEKLLSLSLVLKTLCEDVILGAAAAIWGRKSTKLKKKANKLRVAEKKGEGVWALMTLLSWNH